MAGHNFSAVSGKTSSYQLLFTNFQNALANPINERCILLNPLLKDSSLKELQYIFPLLIENIFGFRTGDDWGFLTLDKGQHPREFENIRYLLAPEGPVLKLVYKFMEELNPKFELPVACLPMSSQMMLQEGKVPSLYVNKLQLNGSRILPTSIHLNAFEFYFYHFAYFMVNSVTKNTLSIVNQHNALYGHILEDYLLYFLPCDIKSTFASDMKTNVQHSPILTSSLSTSYGSPVMHSDIHGYSPPSVFSMHSPSIHQMSPPAHQQSRLLKKDAFSLTPNSPLIVSPHHSSQVHSWQAETLILILKEVYLNQNTLEPQRNTTLNLMTKIFIPSHYHVWMVRIFIKHLHFFFNSSMSNPSGMNQVQADALSFLRGIGMTQLMNKESYCFLKTTFDHWPLDASFRIPLETYLSYIQPWRYTRFDFDFTIWHKFIIDNLLFYSAIFQQILKRILRMDLNCPKTAYMLFRVTKVLCTSKMRDIILQAEQGPSSSTSSIGSSQQSSPTKFPFRKASRLDNTFPAYLPLFSEPVYALVSRLLSAVTVAQSKASVTNPTSNGQPSNTSFLQWMCSIFSTSSGTNYIDEHSPVDIRKLSSYLESSATHLSEFFTEVTVPSMNTSSTFISSSSIHGGNVTDIPRLSTNQELTFLERSEILAGRKKVSVIAYQGNPDLQPVRSYEIGFLVKFLQELSEQLSEKYAAEINNIYHCNSFWSKVCRRVLAKPDKYINTVKSKDMLSVTRTPIVLPPRLNLRPLASKHLIGYFLLYLLMAYSFGYDPIVSLAFLCVIIVFCVIFSALLYPAPIVECRID